MKKPMLEVNMKPKNDGGAAFPCNSPDGFEAYKGMSLSQYYTGMAMQGIMANPGLLHLNLSEKTERAFAVADLMLSHEESENKEG